MKKSIPVIALLLAFSVLSSEAQRERCDRQQHRQRESRRHRLRDGGRWNFIEMEGVSGRWLRPHPAVLVIHGGGFRVEPVSAMTLQAGRDAAAAASTLS
jgi:hypothetical protein